MLIFPLRSALPSVLYRSHTCCCILVSQLLTHRPQLPPNRQASFHGNTTYPHILLSTPNNAPPRRLRRIPRPPWPTHLWPWSRLWPELLLRRRRRFSPYPSRWATASTRAEQTSPPYHASRRRPRPKSPVIIPQSTHPTTHPAELPETVRGKEGSSSIREIHAVDPQSQERDAPVRGFESLLRSEASAALGRDEARREGEARDCSRGASAHTEEPEVP